MVSRKLIQSLGKRYGCHQCGSRQVFRGADSGGIFIADHQPPTKMAKAMADAWWRKWLGRGYHTPSLRHYPLYYIPPTYTFFTYLQCGATTMASMPALFPQARGGGAIEHP